MQGICERCNNINAALTGVDVPSIVLVDPSLQNPAIKGIIFDVDNLDETEFLNWIDTYKVI